MSYIFALSSLINHINSFKEKKGNKNKIKENLPEYEAIIPAKNEELNIRDCLTSIINQTYKPKRIHIINDGSTDKTLDIVLSTIESRPGGKCYETLDTLLGNLKFKLIKCKDQELEYFIWSNNDNESLGKGRAINALVLEGHIKTPYFLSVDADTIIDSTLAEKSLREITKDSKIAAIYCYTFSAPEENTLIGNLYSDSYDISSRISNVIFRSGGNILGFHYALSGPRVLFSTEAYSKCPRPTDTKAGDTAHAWELQAKGYKIKCILNCYGITRMPSRLKSILKQRINWHSGPFQNFYIRGLTTLKNLKQESTKRFLGGMFTIGYYVFFSPAYNIKWGILVPLLTLSNQISFDITLRYYAIDYLVSLLFALYSTKILKKYGYYKEESPLTFYKKFNIFYFFYRPLVAYITTYCGIKFIKDIVIYKLKKSKMNWTGFT